MPFVTAWMELEGIMLSEMSQAKKDKYCMTAFRREIKKKERKKLTETEQINGCQRLGVEGGCGVMRQGSGWGCEGDPKAQTSS